MSIACCMYHAYTMHALHAPCIVTQDLIKKLLTADLTKRLGNLKAGADDVKKHKWFTACTPPTNFEALLAGKGEAPIKARRAARAMGHTRTRAAPHSRPTDAPLSPFTPSTSLNTTPNPCPRTARPLPHTLPLACPQPEVSESAGDTSNFDDYPDSAEGSTVACDPRDNKLFEDF